MLTTERRATTRMAQTERRATTGASRIAHSAQRNQSVSNPSATSPTVCSDFADTLSMVSCIVW